MTIVPRSAWRLGALLAAAAVAGGCGSAAITEHTAAPAMHAVVSRPPVGLSRHSATIRFGEGRQSVDFEMREPAGVILLYRISAPAATKVEGTTQLPDTTVPLLIRTSRTGPSSSCGRHGRRVVCTVGEEWCPMPKGTWRVHLRKLAGPAGAVTFWFRVGDPRGNRTPAATV
ncbi:MAG: hypothetical protein ACRDQE_05615 [Gaiellales bacterium]